MIKWYSLFSHTGRETENIKNACEGVVYLDTAITDNAGYSGDLPYIKLIDHKCINEWLVEPGNVEPGSIVTLNGYMGILPAEVLEYLRSIDVGVYNIHPAPIQLYPDLRGKDPQIRMYEGLKSGKYVYAGVVIHKVDEGVDTGEIVHWSYRIGDPSMTFEDFLEQMHELGLQLWVEFFTKGMYNNG